MCHKWRNKTHIPSCMLAKLPEEVWGRSQYKVSLSIGSKNIKVHSFSKPCSDPFISKENAGVCEGPDLCEEPVSHTGLPGRPRWRKAQFLYPGMLFLKAAVAVEALLEEFEPRVGGAWPEAALCQQQLVPDSGSVPVVVYSHLRLLLNTALLCLTDSTGENCIAFSGVAITAGIISILWCMIFISKLIQLSTKRTSY